MILTFLVFWKVYIFFMKKYIADPTNVIYNHISLGYLNIGAQWACNKVRSYVQKDQKKLKSYCQCWTQGWDWGKEKTCKAKVVYQ